MYLICVYLHYCVTSDHMGEDNRQKDPEEYGTTTCTRSSSAEGVQSGREERQVSTDSLASCLCKRRVHVTFSTLSHWSSDSLIFKIAKSPEVRGGVLHGRDGTESRNSPRETSQNEGESKGPAGKERG